MKSNKTFKILKTPKIIGVHYAYNKKREKEKYFKNHIQKREIVLNIWKMKNLTLDGKIIIFKKYNYTFCFSNNFT